MMTRNLVLLVALAAPVSALLATTKMAPAAMRPMRPAHAVATPLKTAPAVTAIRTAAPQMLVAAGPSAVDYLLFTSFYTATLWAPYVLHAIFNAAGQSLNPIKLVKGLLCELDYSKTWFKPEKEVPFAGWASRAAAAHKNACENLVVFAPLLLAATLKGVPGLAAPAKLYFYSRLLHYPAAISNVFAVRTLSFFGGIGADLWIAKLALL